MTQASISPAITPVDDKATREALQAKAQALFDALTAKIADPATVVADDTELTTLVRAVTMTRDESLNTLEGRADEFHAAVYKAVADARANPKLPAPVWADLLTQYGGA